MRSLVNYLMGKINSAAPISGGQFAFAGGCGAACQDMTPKKPVSNCCLDNRPACRATCSNG